MKKLLLLLSVTIATTSNFIAQTVPNGGFENWTTNSFENLDAPWDTPNSRNLESGLPINVTKINGVSGFGVRLETVANATDTSFAYVANFQNDPSSGEGGVSFSQIPTTLTGYYRYNLGTTDSAIFLVFFKKNGVIISQDFIQFRGATGIQSTFVPFSYPLTSFTTVPDSVIFAAASSNAMSGVGVQVGSFLELDNIGFSGPGVTQQLAGGTFENWSMQTSYELHDWNVSGDQGFSVSPGHTGNYAVQLVTQDYGPDGIWGSGVSIGDNSQSGPVGGMPMSNYVDTLCGYYKYSTPMGGLDSARFMYHGLWFGVMQTGQDFRMGPAANWTYFEFPLNPWMAPIDTLNFSFSSSTEWPINNAVAGSTLLLDDIHLKSQSIGLKNTNPFDGIVKLYPNPTTDVVNFNFGKVINETMEIKIYNVAGQLVASQKMLGGIASAQMNVKELAEGFYSVKIVTASKTMKTSFIKK